MHEKVFTEAARLASLRDQSLNEARTTTIEHLEEFLNSPHRHRLTTFLRLARKYVILLETDPLLVGVHRTYILTGNLMGGLGCLDKDISDAHDGGITQYLRMPGLRSATPEELVDMLIAHGEDPTLVLGHIDMDITKIATEILRAAHP